VSDPETWRGEWVNGGGQVPVEIDVTVPSVARGYDYALGGKNNFESDRVAGEALFAAVPGMQALASANRSFLRRGVRYLVEEAGLRQLIDVGSGLPTAGNVHEVAHEIDPSVRVLYADIDPIVLAHGRALLAANDTTTVIQADAGDPRSILDAPETRELIDLDKPFGVLLSGILHHLPDERDPVGVTQVFKDAMPPGSYMLVSNFLDDDSGDPHPKEAERALTSGFGTGRFRTWEEQRPFLAGLDLIEPGFVYANEWRPDGTAQGVVTLEEMNAWTTYYAAGIGRKP
jgi:hypothetical protein